MREAAQRLAERLARDYNAKYDWQGDSVVFSYKGLNGVIRMQPGEVDVRIRLGLLLQPFKGQIERGVEEALDKVLFDKPSG